MAFPPEHQSLIVNTWTLSFHESATKSRLEVPPTKIAR
jgi:hypothetical protein